LFISFNTPLIAHLPGGTNVLQEAGIQFGVMADEMQKQTL